MKRRSFKRAAFAASLPLLSRSSLSAAEPRSKNKNGSHTVLSCNVRVDVPEDSKTGDGWAHRKEMCAEIIRAQKPDLIGLQETQEIHFTDLKARLPEYDTFAISPYPTSFVPANAIFFLRSRYELISSGGFTLSQTPHVSGSKSWDSVHPRFINWVHLKDRASGKELRYWNTHLDHRGHEARAKAAELIVQAAEAFGDTFPQLLTGDMNADEGHPAIKTLKAGGWSDTYAAVHGPKDPGFTFHGFKGEKHPAANPDGSLKRKIDWVFSRGAVKSIGAAVIRDSRKGHYPSDHYFMSAKVEL